MDVIGVKVFAGFLFFALVLVFGWIPFWFMRRCSGSKSSDSSYSESTSTRNGHNQQPRIVMFLHSMASGVLLSTCLLSLLPEAIEAMHQALGSSRTLLGKREYSTTLSTKRHTLNGSVDNDYNVVTNRGHRKMDIDKDDEGSAGFYPLAELLIGLGFLTIYVIDSCVKSVKGGYKKSHVSSSADDAKEIVIFKRNETISRHSKNSDTRNDENEPTMSEHGLSVFSSQSSKRPRFLNDQFSQDFEPLMEHPEDSPQFSVSINDNVENNNPATELHPIADASKTKDVHYKSRSAALRSVALVTALCIHGFFDGVLLGLQTSVHVLLSLLFALSVHKSFVSLSLSLTLFSNHGRGLRTSRAFLYFISFATVAPLGLAMSAGFVHKAVGMSENGEASLIPGSLQAFAVGTFMYVTFTETTGHHKGKSLWVQLVNHMFLLVGFSIMAGLRAALGEV